MRNTAFWLAAAAVGIAFVVLTRVFFTNEYYFFAAYVVLQYVVLSTAWNILGGYTGYINFGTGAFFAMGAYTSVVLHKMPALTQAWFEMQIPAIPLPLMIVLAVISVAIARTIERSTLGLGFAAIRDDELAAEAGGVPTLRLKLIATTLSGALMGMAGAPLPYYVTYLDPTSSFNLAYAVNSVAMPVIGGMTSWIGPIIGAILLGTIQQVATVTISSALNLLIVGLLLIGFVMVAPNGIVGLVQARRPNRSSAVDDLADQRRAEAHSMAQQWAIIRSWRSVGPARGL